MNQTNQDAFAMYLAEAVAEGGAHPNVTAAARLVADFARWAAGAAGHRSQDDDAAELLGYATGVLKLNAAQRGDRKTCNEIEARIMTWSDVVCEVAPPTPNERLERAADEIKAGLGAWLPFYKDVFAARGLPIERAAAALVLDVANDGLKGRDQPIDAQQLTAVVLGQLIELRERLAAGQGVDSVERFDGLVRSVIAKVCKGGLEPFPASH